jgi:3-methyl-2-oxobutanoate hydroxymethyltransferase
MCGKKPAAGINMILVGDSGGIVQLGYQTTNPVTMDEMITLSGLPGRERRTHSLLATSPGLL